MTVEEIQLEQSILEDVVKNIFTNRYSIEEIISSLARLEQPYMKKFQLELFKKYQPKYYTENLGATVLGITLIKDIETAYNINLSDGNWK